MTLNLHLCIPFLFAIHLLMMDNNVTKYHQYPSRHSKVMDRTRFAQTDRRTDGQTDGRTDKVIPIYPLNFVRGGGGGNVTSSLTKFVTLNLHLCIPLLFETHLLMMDNNVTRYHQYPSRHSKVMDRTRFAQTDGRKDRQSDSYIPPPPPPELRSWGVLWVN